MMNKYYACILMVTFIIIFVGQQTNIFNKSSYLHFMSNNVSCPEPASPLDCIGDLQSGIKQSNLNQVMKDVLDILVQRLDTNMLSLFHKRNKEINYINSTEIVNERQKIQRLQ